MDTLHFSCGPFVWNCVVKQLENTAKLDDFVLKILQQSLKTFWRNIEQNVQTFFIVHDSSFLKNIIDLTQFSRLYTEFA